MSHLDKLRTHPQRTLAVFAYVAVVLIASVISTPAGGLSPIGPLGLVGLDKWLHAVGYAGLGFALAFAVRAIRLREVGGAIAVAGLYGLCIEFVQAGLPYRTFSVMDMGANVLGAMLGGVLWYVVVHREGRWG
ncbi:antibiotic resistance protein VanZ [Haloferax mediterranei ATCC 33500]|uniref:Antibiotic resistance protein VanZ n=1 Tax=Haloferax mediterranei (strain ATCC 33500 / DSM 1411 / JCM 8866 / NBRC 14739 / NCIMB 2177 / R-4) TaxID=523841 RepID=I3R1U8_HALMT|nr:VanZ family protein [Haloferax mediterranei]AFK18208.1 VanZ like family protein [Haloferax mediterranei ATCC 33500]AHZ22389.1 antibiotic resistance protein VanZ [Haloferax mediterranei ATCC 33500]EMA02519.1 VanZ like family protein [Haloferax mediterranei ATCC 33500]MDX5988297.1 VanZ family protein [Haloferax mediterranei ATCC 33500]QCQ74733.1 antibiotic resistance protein VanZ [Haloferax mediterranei ATCC 33500]